MVDKKIVAFIGIVFVAGILLFLNSPTQKTSDVVDAGELRISVFKSPTCGCCNGWVEYLEENGLKVITVNTQDMSSIKEQYQVPEEMESCHTAVIEDYFVEGHVPVEAIKKLIEEKPAIKGIALPGMPIGAPGMPGPKTSPFEVYAISDDAPSVFFIG